jgi:hypothetical protein
LVHIWPKFVSGSWLDLPNVRAKEVCKFVMSRLFVVVIQLGEHVRLITVAC